MTLAIIGAGPSGLVSAKTAVECGLTPTIFEKAADIGGVWNPETGFTWETMRTNISYYTCMFSDFAWTNPKEDFPNQREVYEYLCNYMKTFNLEHFLQLKATIVKVTQANDKTWNVEWIKDSQSYSQCFNFVIIASGIFSKAAPFNIQGIENFKGRISHAKDYKHPHHFSNKRVAIIGNSFSGCEIASEVASVAQRVIHVARRTMWILPRYISPSQTSSQKIPLDLLFYSRAAAARSVGVSTEELNQRRHTWFYSIRQQGTICPELAVEALPIDPPFVAISDSYIDLVKEKKIFIKKDMIQQITENTLFFDKGDIEEVDEIIFSHGYQVDLPFFEKDILELIGYKPEDQLQPLLLHKTVFSPKLPGLAFVGLYRGPYFGVMELQARWACMVFSEKIPAPSQEAMEKGVDEELKIREMRPRPQFPHGDYVRFADDLAKEIGALPDFEKLKVENPDLYKILWEHFLTPVSYRFIGFGSRPEFVFSFLEKNKKRFEV